MTANAIVEVKDLTKRYGNVTALDHVSFSLVENQIVGLLGRNGAGKTTLMHLLTAQIFPSEGSIQVFGEAPYENDNVLRKVCFIKESQQYNKTIKVAHVLNIASLAFPNWDEEYAQRLIREFQLPLNRKVVKLSRGMSSALGIIVGLASRAPLTIFDEPYLGLDATSRVMFYELLLEDYSLHPRTVILSTHLIDEVSRLLEHVYIVDHGKLILDKNADELRGTAYTVNGSVEKVERFTQSRTVLHSDSFGTLQSSVIWGAIDSEGRNLASELGLELGPVSLQQLIIYLTSQSSPSESKGGSL